MDVAELFKNIRDIKGEIMTLEKHEEYIRLSMLPGAVRYDKDNVQSSPEDPMLKFAEKISEDEELIQQRLVRLKELNLMCQKILDQMPTAKYRNLLLLRYIEGGLKYRYSWSEVAMNIGYDEQYTRWDLHHAALDEAQETYNDMEKIETSNNIQHKDMI